MVACYTFSCSVSCVCVWPSSSFSKACNPTSSNNFGGLPRSAFLTSKLPLLNLLNHSLYCVRYSIHQERALWKLRQAFDEILLPIYPKRKPKINAPRKPLFEGTYFNIFKSKNKHDLVLNLKCLVLNIVDRWHENKRAPMVTFDKSYNCAYWPRDGNTGFICIHLVD